MQNNLAAASRQKKLKFHWKGWLAAQVLRLLRFTWRIEMVDQFHYDTVYNSEKPTFLYFWHGKYVPVLPILEGYQGCVISSQSERGGTISDISRRFGFKTLLIPDKPDRASVKHMLAEVIGHRTVGTAADGPLGPKHQVKGGIVWIASKTGAATIPLSIASKRKWVIETRWDSLEIPKPFTRVTMIFGEPIYVPKSLNVEQTNVWRNQLTERLTAVDQRVEQMH